MSYRTSATYDLKSSYVVVSPIPPAFSGNDALHAAVVDHLNGLLAAAGTTQVQVTRDEIERHLRGLPRWRASQTRTLRDGLQVVMVRLVDRRQVDPVEAFAGRTRHTVVDTDPAQREVLARIVSGFDRIASGDPKALADGMAYAGRIVGDPERVCRLLEKGFRSSKHVANPVSKADKQQRVLAALTAGDGVRTSALLDIVTPHLNAQLLRQTLGQLAHEGLVRGEQQPDGPYKLWYLTRPTELLEGDRR